MEKKTRVVIARLDNNLLGISNFSRGVHEMLKIRQAQMDAFSDSLERTFFSRMFVHLRSDFSPQIELLRLDDLTLEAMIRRGIEKARSYGVVRESDIELYLESMVLLGPDFDQRIGCCASALKDKTLDGGKKMDAINEYLLFGGEEPL